MPFININANLSYAVRSLLVSIEGPLEITLPVSTVELTASVTPAPQPGRS